MTGGQKLASHRNIRGNLGGRRFELELSVQILPIFAWTDLEEKRKRDKSHFCLPLWRAKHVLTDPGAVGSDFGQVSLVRGRLHEVLHLEALAHGRPVHAAGRGCEVVHVPPQVVVGGQARRGEVGRQLRVPILKASESGRSY